MRCHRHQHTPGGSAHGLVGSTCISALLLVQPVNDGRILERIFSLPQQVDGVYDCDPMKNPNAKLHRALSYSDVRTHNLAVMDDTAITLCKENEIPVCVFNLNTPGNIQRALLGDATIGTIVTSGANNEDLAASLLNGNSNGSANNVKRELVAYFSEN